LSFSFAVILGSTIAVYALLWQQNRQIICRLLKEVRIWMSTAVICTAVIILNKRTVCYTWEKLLAKELWQSIASFNSDQPKYKADVSFCITLGFKCSLTDWVEIWFQFSVLVMWLKSAIIQCKCTSKCHCCVVAGWNALLGHHSWVAVGLGMSFYLKVFMRFVLQKTVAMTIVYVLIVLYYKHGLMVIHRSFPLLLSLSPMCCSRLCKVHGPFHK
jgi:hypothetical protein